MCFQSDRFQLYMDSYRAKKTAAVGVGDCRCFVFNVDHPLQFFFEFSWRQQLTSFSCGQ